MNEQFNLALLLAAALSAIAALLHVGIIVGGAPWYRFFGAGERLTNAAAAGRAWPDLITAAIALTLWAWAVYALGGAGLFSPLPASQAVLSAITAIFLLRGLAIVPLLLGARTRVTPFLVWSSVLCIAIGALHLLGLIQVWKTL